jgi:hypothetical protein
MSLGFMSTFGAPHRPRRTKFEHVEFIPQAILGVPIGHFAELGYEITPSRDELDRFEGTTLFSEAVNLPVAVRYYAGYPEGTTTIYLPQDVKDVDRITKIIGSLLEEFKLQPRDVMWERKDDPEL